MEQEKGTLYLCATPIGNLEDMTFRGVRMMREADLIAAEDTRHTRKLLSHYEIHTPLTSYHEHNKFEKGPRLIKELEDGKNVLLVSDAGLPGIADPGSHLVGMAIAAGVKVTPLPGANAALSGLICSGLDTTGFWFVGFLPKTAKKRRALLASLQDAPVTLLFYESPHRVKATLKELCEAMGGRRRAVAARELTKKFEEFVRGTLQELCAHMQQVQPKGEFCLIVEGKAPAEDAQEAAAQPDPAVLVMEILRAGGSEDKKAAIKQAAEQLGVSKREVYQAVIGMKK